MSATQKRRIHIFCLTYGEPPENKFWPQFQYSWSILNRLTRRVAPIPKFVTPLLAARRGRERSQKFEELGWNSPLEEISARQVDVLQEMFDRLLPEDEVTVELVCEFRSPMLDVYLERLIDSPPDEILVLPLYVAESDFTTGISRTDFETFHQRWKGEHGLPAPRYVKGFGFDDRFADAYAKFILDYCEQHGWDDSERKESALVLGAHGTVVTIPPGYNSGAQETGNLFRLVRKRLKDKFAWMRIGWLNHELGGMWTCPSCEETGEQLRERGITKVVYFPFGFIGDNGESMLEGREQLGDQWDDLLYLPCPNDDRDVLGVMAEMTKETLEDPTSREDWETVGQGREIYERPEPPKLPGEEAPLNFKAPTLAMLAAGFWAIVGVFLTARGIDMFLGLESGILVLFVVIVASAVIAYGKGMAVFKKLARKNLTRLRRLPQPSPVYTMFSKASWIVIVVMATFGMSLRFLNLPEPLYATILMGVGGAMLVGVMTYLLELDQASRPSAKSSLRGATARG